jgi:hypothetical protein
VASCSRFEKRWDAQGKTHLTEGKRSGKKASVESCDSNSSEWKVEAVLERPWSRITVWVCGAVGGWMEVCSWPDILVSALWEDDREI